ncbi:MAG: hypothetical protein ACPGU2_05200 [Candidatus Puniceispirillaceae bacterium]|nr:hypothetical protein [Pseudomonadota bacterium]
MGRIKQKQIEQSTESRPVTLAWLSGQNLAVFCWCNACGHNAEIPAGRFIERFGQHYPVPELGVSLKCSHCQSKNISTRPSWPRFGGQIARHGTG